MESRRPLAEFDTLGFSLAYELGGANILEMMKQCASHLWITILPSDFLVPRRIIFEAL